MQVVAQKKSDCKILLQGESACAWSASRSLSGLQDISRKDISASSPDSPLLPPSPQFPYFVCWMAEPRPCWCKNRISHRRNSVLYVLVGLSGGSCWRRKGEISWLHFISCFVFLFLFFFLNHYDRGRCLLRMKICTRACTVWWPVVIWWLTLVSVYSRVIFYVLSARHTPAQVDRCVTDTAFKTLLSG